MSLLLWIRHLLYRVLRVLAKRIEPVRALYRVIRRTWFRDRIHPHTKSQRVALRPATPADGRQFYQALLDTGLESVPAISEVEQLRAEAMFLVTRRASGEVLGFCTLHAQDGAGHMRSGIYLDTTRARHGVGAEALLLTINYAFAAFPIDRLFVETTEASFDRLGISSDGSRETEKVGVIPDHLYFRGRLWDLHSYVIDREMWDHDDVKRKLRIG